MSSDDLTGEQFEQIWQGKPEVPPNLRLLATVVEHLAILDALLEQPPDPQN